MLTIVTKLDKKNMMNLELYTLKLAFVVMYHGMSTAES